MRNAKLRRPSRITLPPSRQYHLDAYLGVGFALPHHLWTGPDFLDSTARTVFWCGL
jgi:hypothetical protein